MHLPAAPMSMNIKVVTAGVLISMASLFAGSLFYGLLLLPAFGIVVISIICYLFAPIGYDISARHLTIVYRRGGKNCGLITNCRLVNERMPMTWRLWGNGGLFAGTGLFWNKKYRYFRAYVTTTKTSHYVLAETAIGKVLVTPADPELFIEIAGYSTTSS